jgi:phosphatidylglycerol:prolipoprotein diacylglycerol transferase
MLSYSAIDPVAISLGPVKIHWYGLMYLVGFGSGAILGWFRARRSDQRLQVQIWDLLFFISVGVIVGGRLGYVFFYNLDYYWTRPIEWLFIWSGGMSFHGGLLGAIVALWAFSRRTKRTFLEVGDFVAPLCPIGFGAGRIGNFINQELWGRVSDAPWAMVFPEVGPESRHPSQLYEAFLEGVVLFLVLWFYSRKPRLSGAVCGMFLLSYGALRFLAEFFREPDAHLGIVAMGWMTMGQLLSAPMVFFGFSLWVWAVRRKD